MAAKSDRSMLFLSLVMLLLVAGCGAAATPVTVVQTVVVEKVVTVEKMPVVEVAKPAAAPA